MANDVTDVAFAVSSRSEFSDELEHLGLGEEEVVVGAFDDKGMKYAMTESFR